MFEPNYPLDRLVPASYNPRQIDEAAFAELKASLSALGLIKPVIVTQQGVLVAGHQRTKAMQALGWTHAPAFVLPSINTADEIRFNQLHNASDLDAGAEQVRIPSGLPLGFRWVQPADIHADALRVPHAMKKSEILRLLAKYGDWGSAVATQDGRVHVSGLYTLCCKIIGRPCLVHILETDKADILAQFFGREYGQFSYAHLPKTTWAQSLAQMMRIRDEDKVNKCGTVRGSSRTYENLVLPLLIPEMRVLDFGAGQMDYVKKLRAQGVDIRGIEFYLRKGHLLDTAQAGRDCDALCTDLAARGRFDLVVCDSVLNSVDSVQAEQDVLLCLHAFCKPSGTVIFSGRSRSQVERKASVNTINTDANGRYLHFLDGDGFSAMYGQGIWRYQKFHTYQDIERLARSFFGETFALYDDSGKPAKATLRKSAWGVIAQNGKPHAQDAVEAALRREFDLPLPGGKTFGRGEQIVAAWHTALDIKG